MKSYSHRLIGIAILENMLQAENRLSKQAFLLGCIEPDYNFITYFRGSVKYDTLRGHNYENSFECMRRISDKLIGKRVWGAIEYYRLGKLIHYILDAFTYPHNGIFSGSIMEHRDCLLYTSVPLHNIEYETPSKVIESNMPSKFTLGQFFETNGRSSVSVSMLLNDGSDIYAFLTYILHGLSEFEGI